MSGILQTIKSAFAGLFKDIKLLFAQIKKYAPKILLTILLFGVVIINSGYCYTYLLEDTMAKTIVLLVSLFIIGFIFVLLYDFGRIKIRLKAKRPSVCFIIVCAFALSVVLTMIGTQEVDNLVAYAAFGIRIVCAYLVAKLFNFQKFIRVFQNAMFILCLLAILFYLVGMFSGTATSILPTFTSQRNETFINYFFLAFQGAHNRLQSVFWEPGLLSSFIILALSFEILFNKKVRWPYIAIYVIAMFFTSSTFGYLMLAAVGILAINRKVNNFWIAALLYTLIMGTIVSYIVFADNIILWLAKVLPAVFKKFVDNGNVVLIDNSRFFSPYINFQIWLKSPVWGCGIINTGVLFEEKMTEFGIDAMTSTSTYYLAEFGILGLLPSFALLYGIFKIKNLEIENKVVLAIIFLLILNKEPHDAIMFDYVFIFLTIKEFVDKDDVALAFEKPSDKSLLHCFRSKDDQSVVKKNIVLSFGVKGLALALGFFSYPLYMSYFNDDSVMGVWSTVLSVMAMIITLDLGLGNGLKNKMVKALHDDDKLKQKELISSTYISSLIVSLLIIGVAIPIIFCSDLNSFLNIEADKVDPQTLKISIFLVLVSIAIEFTLKNVTSLVQAKQKQGLSSVFPLLSTLMLMAFAVIFRFESKAEALLFMSTAYILTINVPLLIGTLIVFPTMFKGLYPSFKHFTKQSFKDVTYMGLGFFAIQIMLLLLNSTNEILIANMNVADQVVEYSIYSKPFNIIVSLYSIVTLPYWAMVAKEKEEGNTSLIKYNLKQCLLFFAIFAVLGLFLAVAFDPFQKLWLGEEKAIIVNYGTVFIFLLYIVEWMLLAAFTSIANGLSIIKPQVILFVIAAAIKVGGVVLMYCMPEMFENWVYLIITNAIAYVPLIVGLAILVLRAIKKIKRKAEVTNEEINN